MMSPVVCCVFLLQAAQLDTARLVDNRVVVEPVGVSVEVPRGWLAAAEVEAAPARACWIRAGSRAPTLVTNPAELRALRSPQGQFTAQFAQVVDSVMPLASLVAHIAPAGWMTDPSCTGPYIRIYTTSESPEAVHARTSTAQVTNVSPPPVERFQQARAGATRDSAEWKTTIVHWGYARYDAGYSHEVHFLTRMVRGRTVVVVLMHIGTRSRPETFAIARSFAIRP
jgi:hypothetical protein